MVISSCTQRGAAAAKLISKWDQWSLAGDLVGLSFPVVELEREIQRYIADALAGVISLLGGECAIFRMDNCALDPVPGLKIELGGVLKLFPADSEEPEFCGGKIGGSALGIACFYLPNRYFPERELSGRLYWRNRDGQWAAMTVPDRSGLIRIDGARW